MIQSCLKLMSEAEKDELRNITRMDYARIHGWNVRFRRWGRTHSKLFSDGVWGSSREALEAAQRWRDYMEQTLPQPMSPHHQGGRRSETISASGVRGLHVSARADRLYVRISLMHEGQRHTKAFPLVELGPRRATWNACTYLAKLLDELGLAAVDAMEAYQRAFPYVHRRYVAFLAQRQEEQTHE